MHDSTERRRRKGPVRLSELVSGVIAPVGTRRGFATADLLAAWPEIVGRGYADCTRPDKLVWPRGDDQSSGVLHVTVAGPKAVLFQHELGQIVERVNAFLGYAAIARIKLAQGPVTRRAVEVATPRPLDATEEGRLAEAIADVGDDALKAALARLGRGVLADD